MSMFAVYTVRVAGVEVDRLTSEAAAEAVAEQHPNSTVDVDIVPVPDVVIGVVGQSVVWVRTTDGQVLEEVTVREWGDDGCYREYTV